MMNPITDIRLSVTSNQEPDLFKQFVVENVLEMQKSGQEVEIQFQMSSNGYSALQIGRGGENRLRAAAGNDDPKPETIDEKCPCGCGATRIGGKKLSDSLQEPADDHRLTARERSELKEATTEQLADELSKRKEVAVRASAMGKNYKVETESPDTFETLIGNGPVRIIIIYGVCGPR